MEQFNSLNQFQSFRCTATDSWGVLVFKPTDVGVVTGRRVLCTNRIRSRRAMKNQPLYVMPSMKLLNYELKRTSLSPKTEF